MSGPDDHAPSHGRPPDSAEAVQQMFDRISGRYDLMNRLITLGQDRRWRRWVVQEARLPREGGRLLDLGAGTGDIAAEALRQRPGLQQVVAADLSASMMSVGRARLGDAPISWCQVDALRLPFADASFDAVTSGYLARNVADRRQLFAEQLRVVKPGGRVVCLDTTPPPPGAAAPLVRFHMAVVIPALGKLVAGDGDAYRYLPETTEGFLAPEALAEVMSDAGLVDVAHRTFMLGTQAIHAGSKPGS